MNKIFNKAKDAYDFIIDTIFPKYCVGCNKEGDWICRECKNKIILIKIPTCPRCKKITNKGQFCKNCRKNTHLSGVIVAAYYSEGPLKEAIHTFKYNGVYDLKDDLGNILVGALNEKWKKESILVPVPLHKKRKAERGYNQAELLAESVSKKIGYKLVKDVLIREKYTTPQVSLSGKKRKENVKNIFKIKNPNYINKKTVLLVDDVYTTGATLEECAIILKKEGAKEVWGLVLAKV